jgi:hypothetical protein
VQDVVNCKINALLHAHPFVWSFNGRIGNVCLTIDDVNAALTAPGAIAYATTPPLGDASGRIATTLFVDNSIEDLRSWVDQQNFAFDQQLTLYAPLASPQFSGIPTAPTAPPATSTGQIATTAYVMAAVQAATSGVVSFNGRTGIVDLLDTDITNAGGALLVSPVFTGTPQAPTATLGTDTGQLATCAFVIAELGGASIGVMTFNTRAGAVVLTAADITGAGGALLAGPAFSGVPTAPTAGSGTATQQLATTAFVTSAIAALSIGVASFNSRTGAVTLTTNDISAAGGAVLASPIFSGQPTAPTASPGTSTTQLATTAFVAAAIAAAPIVSSFNGRAGAVTLTAADVSAAGGPYLPLVGGTLTGNLGINATAPILSFQRSAGQAAQLAGYTGTSQRWNLVLASATAETGGNAGSDLSIGRWSDAGALLDVPLSIIRASGSVVLERPLLLNSATNAALPGGGSALVQAALNSVSGPNSALFVQKTDAGGIVYPCYFVNNAASSVGNISISDTATSFNTSSDLRLKQNVTPFMAGRQILEKLDVKNFEWRAGGTAVGLIAQQTHDVYPAAVQIGRGEPGDADFMPWSIDYSKYVPVLVQALQEAHERVDALMRRVAALEQASRSTNSRSRA